MGIGRGPWITAVVYAVVPQLLPCIPPLGSTHQGEYSDQHQKYCASNPICADVLPWVGHFVVKTFDDPVALFTLVLTLSTIGLWAQTERLARGGEETAKRQLRAYLMVQSKELGVFDDDEIPTEFVFEMTNVGQTPAKIISIMRDINIFDSGHRELPEGHKDFYLPHHFPNTNQPLFAGGVRRFSARKSDLTKDQKGLIKKGEKLLFIWGSVLYRDAFDREWLTNFRYAYGGEEAARRKGLMACSHGNDCT
jgi:hypothetical protein